MNRVRLMISDMMKEFPALFEESMQEFIPTAGMRTPVIDEAMRYSLFAGGKRLRPMLMAAAYEAFSGESWEQSQLLRAFMTALEMIHTYSLIHDDLPAMDNDDLRRGKKTNHIVFGEDMAILAGDGLLNAAFEVMSEAADRAQERQSDAVYAMTYLSRASGVRGMIGGQAIDVSGQYRDEKSVLAMYQKKTGALLAAAVVTGAVLGGATEADQHLLGIAAVKAGMAFQIQDDILDVTGDEEQLGKPIGSDEKRDLVTYVTLTGLERSRQDADRFLQESLDILDRVEGDTAGLKAIIASLAGRSF